MSRSYRKPYIKDGYGSKSKPLRKRRAARRVRKASEVPNGGAYKKFFNPYEICDWSWRVRKPVKGGRMLHYNRWQSEEEMIRNYLRATRK